MGVHYTQTDQVKGLNARLTLPAQSVDATPSNQLIRQYFPWRTDLFGCTRSKPSQGGVPTDLTSRAILGLVFSARWVRAECCVDPLRPPRLPDTWSYVISSEETADARVHRDCALPQRIECRKNLGAIRGH